MSNLFPHSLVALEETLERAEAETEVLGRECLTGLLYGQGAGGAEFDENDVPKGAEKMGLWIATKPLRTGGASLLCTCPPPVAGRGAHSETLVRRSVQHALADRCRMQTRESRDEAFGISTSLRPGRQLVLNPATSGSPTVSAVRRLVPDLTAKGLKQTVHIRRPLRQRELDPSGQELGRKERSDGPHACDHQSRR